MEGDIDEVLIEDLEVVPDPGLGERALEVEATDDFLADPDVLGYHVCDKCGNWAPDRRTCPHCLAVLGATAGQTVDVELAGHVVSVGSRKRQQRRGGYKSSTRAANVDTARKRAHARLKACYPHLYEAMVAEELARMGEKPIKTRTDAVRALNRIAVDSVTSAQRPA